MIRRNVDVIAVAVLLGAMALCSTARQVVFVDVFGPQRIVLNRIDNGRLMNVSCPLSPPVVLR